MGTWRDPGSTPSTTPELCENGRSACPAGVSQDACPEGTATSSRVCFCPGRDAEGSQSPPTWPRFLLGRNRAPALPSSRQAPGPQPSPPPSRPPATRHLSRSPERTSASSWARPLPDLGDICAKSTPFICADRMPGGEQSAICKSPGSCAPSASAMRGWGWFRPSLASAPDSSSLAADAFQGRSLVLLCPQAPAPNPPLPARGRVQDTLPPHGHLPWAVWRAESCEVASHGGTHHGQWPHHSQALSPAGPRRTR